MQYKRPRPVGWSSLRAFNLSSPRPGASAYEYEQPGLMTKAPAAQVFPEMMQIHMHLLKKTEALIGRNDNLKTLSTMYKISLDNNKKRCVVPGNATWHGPHPILKLFRGQISRGLRSRVSMRGCPRLNPLMAQLQHLGSIAET